MLPRSILLSLSLATAAFAAPGPQATASFERGEKALAEEKLAEAESAYKDAIAAAPDYAAAINGLGSVYFKQGKRAEAIQQFRVAIGVDRKFALAWFNLGYAARKVGDFTAAAEAYEVYTQLKPEDPDGFYGLGESWRQLNQPEKAIAAYEQYVAREKRASEQKWVERANQTIRDLKSQLAAAPVAVAAAPAAPAPASPVPTAPAASEPAAPAPAPVNPAELAREKLAAGDRLMQEKNFREAAVAYEASLQANPDNVEANFKLGNTYAVLGSYSQAIECWTKVIELTSDANVKRSAEQNVARARAKLEQVAPQPAAVAGTPQAQEVRPAAASSAPSPRAQARGFYEKGVKQINAGDFAGALKSLSDAIQTDPGLAVAYVARGSANIGLRRFDDAAADYGQAHKLDPSLSSPLYGLAECNRVLGRTAEARRYYEQYVQSTASDVRPELQAKARENLSRLR